MSSSRTGRRARRSSSSAAWSSRTSGRSTPAPSSPPSTSAAPLGTQARESSLKQLIDRVVLTYTKAGKEHGYFGSRRRREIFEHELTYALLHQVFAFNSPGVVQRRDSLAAAGLACFILSVDDSMDSILNWYKEEGKIFQGGSGAGLNLSRIRSSKELLSPPVARPPARSPSCAAPMRARGRSSPEARPAGRPRWSSSTSTTPTSWSSSRPRRARRTRSARCATPASTWTSAARTSCPCSTRTPTTRSGSPTSSCAPSRTAASSGYARDCDGAVIDTVDAKDAVRQDRQGRVGVRRPGHPVRRHHQRLAHQP